VAVRSKSTLSDIQAQLIDETDFLIIDFETTGLYANGGDRVCEIGAVLLRGGAVIETFSTLIDPQRPITAGAYAVNKISPQMLMSAPAFSEIAVKFREMMNNAVLVAYNAPFDMSFLISEYRLVGFPPINNLVIDALAIARQVISGLSKYSQENVASALGINFPVKHRALEDAMVTAKIFSLFTSILKAHDMFLVNDLHRKDLTHVLLSKRLGIVNEALNSKSKLWIKYLSSPNGEILDSIISPIRLGDNFGDSRIHLHAYCHSSDMERMFLMNRILDVRLVKNDRL
jgi:DNA polymerase III epsilon subunit family exonuclease